MARILTADEPGSSGLRRMIFAAARRRSGIVPGIMRVLLVDLRIGMLATFLYARLSGSSSGLTPLQREMVAVVVNGTIGGAP